MALETGTYINDLVITNPTSTDPKSQGDDHIRLIKTLLKECLNGFAGAILVTGTDTGAADVYAIAPTTALAGYTANTFFLVKVLNANTGACTLNVSTLGAKSIKTIAGANPSAGDVSGYCLFVYDGTNMVLLSGSAFLSKTGNQTLTGNLTLTGNETISGALGVTGALSGTTGAFSGSVSGVTEAAGDNSTKYASTAFATQLAFAAALPVQPGGAQQYYLGSLGGVAAWGIIPPASVVRSARTANTILAAADVTTLIDITSGTFSQTLTAAATLGDGWYCWYKNSGTGTVTLDPNASETVNGATTLALTQGMFGLLQCNGVNFSFITASGVGDHCVTVHTGNGHGSTNTMIRRFTTTMTNTGTAITYADSSTLGATFTINEPGSYEIHYYDAKITTSSYAGISLNSSQLTTAIYSINTANRLTYGFSTNGNTPLPMTRIVKLAANDVIRAHTDAQQDAAGAAFTFFSIRKVGL